MALTPSTMVDLGSPMPSFNLENVDGGYLSSDNIPSDRPTLIMFLCKHCPYVVHVAQELSRLSLDYQDSINIIAISSNDIEHYPEDAPQNLSQARKDWNWSFPVLFDATQEVAKSFQAACTPDFFLYTKQNTLCYRGQLDDSRPGNQNPVNGLDLRTAIDKSLQSQEPLAIQKPSMGCNIKWKK